MRVKFREFPHCVILLGGRGRLFANFLCPGATQRSHHFTTNTMCYLVSDRRTDAKGDESANCKPKARSEKIGEMPVLQFFPNWLPKVLLKIWFQSVKLYCLLQT